MSAAARQCLLRALIVTATLAAVLMVYVPIGALRQGKILAGGDFSYLHLRRITFAREALYGRSGNPDQPRLPAWYPRELLGTPFWSNVQNFPFLPTQLLVLLFVEPPDAYLVAVNLAALLTAGFTYLYARRINLPPVAAAAGGWTFACCGFFAGRITAGHLPLLEAMPALPLLLWLIEICLQSPPRDRRFGLKLLAMGVACACVMLAGHPQVPVYALITAGLYLIYRSPGRIRSAAVIAVAMMLGVGVAAFALYPFAMLIARSTRVLALAKADNDVAFPYGRLKAFLFPWADGWTASVSRQPYRRFHGYSHVGYFYDTICYVGWAPILASGFLLIRAIVMRARKQSPRIATLGFFFTVIGVLALVLALPFWQSLMSHIPGTFLRSPARQIYLTSFALALALAAVVNLVIEFIRARRGTSAATIAVALLTLALIGHVMDEGRHARCFLYTQPRPGRAEFATTPAFREFVGDDRAGVDLLLKTAHDFDDVGFFDSIMLARPYRLMLELSGRPATYNTQQFNAAELPRRALEFLGVKLLITRTSRPDLKLENPGETPLVYSTPAPAPRAKFFPAPLVVYYAPDPLHELLRNPGLDLASGLMLPITFMPPTPPPPTRIDSAMVPKIPGATYRRVSTDEIDITVKADQDGYVCVLESYDPGWRATIDGEPAEIVPGDDVFLTVRVKPGEHHVIFRYHTPGAAVGVVISIASVFCLTLLCVTAQRAKTRPV